MTLQDRLDAAKAQFEAKASPEAVAILHRSTAALIASGQAGRSLPVGERAPSFTLPDAHGVPVALAETLARGPLVLTFYRGVWCPFCNLDLQALEAARPAIEARGATLLAVSQQTPANNRKSQRDNGLSFSVLTDVGGSVADAFGLRWTVSGELKALYQRFGVDLPAFNGEGSWSLPMPARYILGADGVVAYAEVNPDYTRRPDPVELLPVLDRLRGLRAA